MESRACTRTDDVLASSEAARTHRRHEAQSTRDLPSQFADMFYIGPGRSTLGAFVLVGVAGSDSVAAFGQRDEGEVTVCRPADEASTLVLRAPEDLGVCQFSQRAMRRLLWRHRGVAPRPRR